mgnify:CR=1 FL=1
MRSGITRRWLRGNLLITVLVVLLAEAMFLYSYTRSYYGSVQQIMYRRFSSVTGQLKMYTGDTAQSAAASRSLALRRMVEQFADKDKYEFMLLDSYGGVIASSSGTDAEGIVSSKDFEQALNGPDGLGVAVYRTQSGEVVMAACSLVPTTPRTWPRCGWSPVWRWWSGRSKTPSSSVCSLRWRSCCLRSCLGCTSCGASWCRWAGGTHRCRHRPG